jgi:hypothetical protein
MDKDTIAIIAITLGAAGMLLAIISLAAGFTNIWLRFQDRKDEWTDKELIALFREHDFELSDCEKHPWENCCPAGCHDITDNQYEHYARLITQESDDAKHG